ncbi:MULTISPECIES: extracellular solute-binding protein [Actinosynnema]|uniref:extracellular solute-binding protein n=1 Tax=Actinosynnema TaxID=40566 RepID=UPI0020A53565|nr:extracellular solute-binding protein [Actinosynnema pretiosum]MCP2097701.1 carbohydrate ABC transporter substrate-binding protein, CUT1 family [Actinosynnema pretiosum]
MAVDRRAFLGLLAATGGAALVGCEAPAPRGGSALGGDALAALLPAHRPVEFAKPDLPGVNGSVPGYLSYPAAPVRAVQGAVLSADVTAMTPSFWPPAPGLGQNSYYDAVNERLGGAVRFETVSGADYQAKLAALMAARQVPELTVVPTFTMPPRFSEGVGEVFRDLTDFLSGERVADYPMLANIPTDSWHACVHNGRLHGVPYPGQLFPEVLFYRDDVFEQLGVEPPRSAEEFAAMAKRLNDPANNRWALGDVFRSLVRAFGGRGDWVRDDSGKLLNQLEAPWYAEAVRFTRSLYDAGCVHPDIVAGNWNRSNELFASRQMVVNQGGMGAWAEQVAQQRPADPGFRMTALPLFAHDGGEPTYPVAAPTAMVAFVRKDVPDDRVRELLRLCDFAAAPIGTEEHRLLRYGVEGVHSARDERGNPALTPLGQKEITLTYGFAAGPPEAITTTDHPDLVRAQHAWYAREWGHQTKPLAFGLRVEEPPEFATLAKEFADRTADVLRGRAELSEVDGLGERWRKAGGDRLREFYDKALRDAGR